MHSFERGPVTADINSDGWTYNVFDAEKNRIAVCFRRDDAQLIVDSLNNCETIIGVSNITELVSEGEVTIDGQVLRLHGDAMCDEGAWSDLCDAAAQKADEVANPPEEDTTPLAVEGQDVGLVKRLLAEGTGHTRAEVAEAFVRAGVRFVKGPFRIANFTRVERDNIPTNSELNATARRLGV